MQQAPTERNLRIGIWGGLGAGKTTFLAALQIDSLNDPGHWIVAGQDATHPGSIRFIENSTFMLMGQRKFPEATEHVAHLGYEVIGTPSPQQLVEIADVWSDDIGRLRFMLDLIDAPGEDFLIQEYQNELFQSLANCDGIVYLYDPLMRREAGDDPAKGYYSFQFLSGALQRVRLAIQTNPQLNQLYEGYLPQFVAICAVKYDDPEVLAKLIEEKLIVVDARSGRAIPRVTNPARILELFPDGPGNQLSGNLLRSFFHPGRIRYFATSSIGFYTPMINRIDLRDCFNVEITGAGRRIRGAIHPINVFTPLIWIAARAMRDRAGRP